MWKLALVLILVILLAQPLQGGIIEDVEGFFVKSIKNNNPGNLRPLPNGEQWQGQTGVTPDGFVIFDTPYNGSRAASIQALNYNLKHGITNLHDFGLRWAPLTENAPGYGESLASYLDVSPDEDFDFEGNLPRLVEAITHNEGGFVAVQYFKDTFQVAAVEAQRHFA